MKASKITLLAIVASVISACQTTPGKSIDMSKALNAEQVRALFTNKTYDGYNELKRVEYQVFSQDDGFMIQKSVGRLVSVPWEIKPDGQHCVDLSSKTSCGYIIPVGNGVYHKVSNGQHMATLKNFIEGNQILFQGK